MNETRERHLLELLIFELGDQRFGLPVSDVWEIIRAVLPVALPGAPAGIEGMINLRGNVVPVLDVRRRLRLPPKALEHTDHFVIARIATRLIALRVDRAVDLVRLTSADVEDLKSDVAGGGQLASRIARVPGGLVVIQNLQTMLSQAEFAALEAGRPAVDSPAGTGEQP